MSRYSSTRGGLLAAFIIGGILIAGFLLLALARQQGLIDEDITTRGLNVLLGLGIAAWGNRIPKALDGPPPASIALAAVRQAVHRVVGWVMMLLGIAVAVLWAFAPRDVAVTGCVVAVVAAIAMVFGYIVWRGVALHRSSTP
ncbi:hypothetical protein [Nitratireductor thuwali]|uniref:Uncharacterized protein n=1 Tax=Nitratireductor thuwali TaxID=2267699 RepID=A0ABY5MM14_9HYPH|nr:hypothetical protein NTH_02355 [Nitratireductor thuwali]